VASSLGRWSRSLVGSPTIYVLHKYQERRSDSRPEEGASASFVLAVKAFIKASPGIWQQSKASSRVEEGPCLLCRDYIRGWEKRIALFFSSRFILHFSLLKSRCRF
jgi:hypothetical protein